MPDPTDPAVRLHHALLSRGETVAAAESLTAGLFCAALATVPGRERDPARRRGRLRDRPEDRAGRGAGGPAGRARPGQPGDGGRARRRVRERCGATWGIGLTGVAGPTRSTGTARAASTWASPTAGGTDVVELDLPGDRAAVRTGAVAAAMDALLARLG